jgi:hypothetical protein
MQCLRRSAIVVCLVILTVNGISLLCGVKSNTECCPMVAVKNVSVIDFSEGEYNHLSRIDQSNVILGKNDSIIERVIGFAFTVGREHKIGSSFTRLLIDDIQIRLLALPNAVGVEYDPHVLSQSLASVLISNVRGKRLIWLWLSRERDWRDPCALIAASNISGGFGICRVGILVPMIILEPTKSRQNCQTNRYETCPDC